MSDLNKPLKAGYTRVFLIEGRARGDHSPQYMSQLKMTGITQPFGDVTKIEIPDPDKYGAFIEVDRIRGSSERATTSLVGRYAATVKSTLLRIARSGCAVDIQCHMGECEDPSDFNLFEKAAILEDVLVTNYSTEDVGALSSEERSKIDETAEISATEIYEVVPLSFSVKAGDLVTNEVLDVIVADTASCGNCESESDGCEKFYAITSNEGGSPGTPPDVVFSLDKGVSWYAHDIDSLADDPSALAKVGNNIVVVANSTGSLHYADVTDITNAVDPAFTEVSTGFVGAGSPNDICSVGRKAFIVGDWGYIYYTEDPTSGVEVLDAGVLTTSDFRAVSAVDEYNALAVGDFGVVALTSNKTDWALLTKPTTDDLICCYMVDENVFWVGSSTGALYYTTDAGATWTHKALPGTTPTRIEDVEFANMSIGYCSADVNSKARLYRTFDGGYSWTVLPEGIAALPAADSINAIAACSKDPDLIVGGGLADDASDGVIMVGKA